MCRRRYHHGSTSAADTHPAVPVSRKTCATFEPLILLICFSIIWRMTIFDPILYQLMTHTRPTISRGRVGAALPAAAPQPVQPATLRPATAAVAPPSTDCGRPRRGTVAESPPPSHCPRRLPRRLPARCSCCLWAQKPRQPPRLTPSPPLKPAPHPGSTRRRRRPPSPQPRAPAWPSRDGEGGGPCR